MKVGVLGLGIIGSVWAKHFHSAGLLAGAWNRTAQPDFPQWQATPEAVATAADVIVVVVADPAAVESVLGRILPALKAGKIVVQSSTIDGESSAKFAAQVEARGARYLAAPFTGSRPAAEQRQTIFYLGGDPALVQELEPTLALISATRLLIGTNEQACTLKLAMNLNLAAQMEALAEALTMCRRSGVADEAFFSAIAKNASYSGLTKLKEPKLRANDFAPQFSVKHMHKDMRLASKQVQFPVLDAVRDALKRAEESGMADDDFASLIRLLAR